MNIKQLRNQRNWSQEQLAQIGGLSIRTIQRIEGGARPSLETLKSLAAAFEVSVENIQQRYVKVDKQRESWKSRPVWLRVLFWGSNLFLTDQRDLKRVEAFIVIGAIVFFLMGTTGLAGEKAKLFLAVSFVQLLGAYALSRVRLLGARSGVY